MNVSRGSHFWEHNVATRCLQVMRKHVNLRSSKQSCDKIPICTCTLCDDNLMEHVAGLNNQKASEYCREEIGKEPLCTPLPECSPISHDQSLPDMKRSNEVQYMIEQSNDTPKLHQHELTSLKHGTGIDRLRCQIGPPDPQHMIRWEHTL